MTLNTSMLDATLMVPYVMPGIVVGIAFVAAFNSPPLALTGTAFVIILSIFIRTCRTRSAPQHPRLPGQPEHGEAAISLGYSPMRAFMKVTVPLILPGIIGGC